MKIHKQCMYVCCGGGGRGGGGGAKCLLCAVTQTTHVALQGIWCDGGGCNTGMEVVAIQGWRWLQYRDGGGCNTGMEVVAIQGWRWLQYRDGGGCNTGMEVVACRVESNRIGGCVVGVVMEGGCGDGGWVW